MSDIEEIKSRLSIVDVVGERVTLKKAGRNFKGLCPFHNEKTPSFVVSPDRETFHCFGCGKGGSIFDFVMLFEHLDFAEALESLADRAGVKLTRHPSDTPEAKLRQKIFEVNHMASEYYHYLLTKHAVGEAARTYLKGRGVSDKSIETFSLGYSPNDWDGLSTFLRKKGYDDNLMETAGLVIRGNRGVYDRFRGRVMFTLKDHRGNVVGFSGRIFDTDAKEAKYINTSETPVYTKGKVLYALDVTKDAIQKANEAILMEGELDVISSFQAGISNVVAIKGSAVTEDHARLLRRFTERLIFALDSDMAGQEAARRGIDVAEKTGFDMRVVTMPSGKDPDEAARESAGLFKKAIKEAKPIYDYLLSSAMHRYDGKTSFGKKKIAEEYLPVIARIENSIVQGHYIRELATSLDVSDDTIQEGLVKLRASGGRKVPETKSDNLPGQATLTRLEKMEMYMLSLLLQGQTVHLIGKLNAEIPTEDISYMPVRRIIEQISTFLREKRQFDVKDFAGSLPSELTPVFDEAFMWDISAFLEDDVRFAREWEKALHGVKQLRLHRAIEEIGQKLRDSDLPDDQYDALQQKLLQSTAALSLLEKEG
jgi:DNA primase